MSDTDRYSPESASTNLEPQPESSSSRWLRVSVISIFVIGIILAVCFWYGFWYVFKPQAKTALNENALIQAHIGEIREMHWIFPNPTSDRRKNVFVFDIIGTKGSGRVAAEFITSDWDTERIASGVIRLANGNEYVLVPK